MARKVFAQQIFAFQPNIFHRILLRGICGKRNTGDLPLCFWNPAIHCRQKLLHRSITMRGGIVPEKPALLPWIERLQRRNRRDSILTIPFVTWMHMKSFCDHIECPIVCLSLTRIPHGDSNRLMALAPDNTTTISPEHMACIFKQYDYFSCGDFFLMCQQFFFISSRFAKTFSV